MAGKRRDETEEITRRMGRGEIKKRKIFRQRERNEKEGDGTYQEN